jgi:hypothetical protein
MKGFEFEAEGRQYSCTVVERKGIGASTWWWFSVSGDMQNYAPFMAASNDTRASVQERVLQFYNNRLFQLSQPTQRGSHWAKRNVPAAQPAQPVAEPVPEVTGAA